MIVNVINPRPNCPACVVPPGEGFERLLRSEAPEALKELLVEEEAILFDTQTGTPPLRLDICTDFGPPDQDKLGNQDAVAFAPLQPPFHGVLVALADGVSNSPYSEFGARLAVQTSVSFIQRQLTERTCHSTPSPDQFQRVFDQTIDEIRKKFFLLWSRVAQSPGDFLPFGWRPSVFLRAVQAKELFLTTLIVVAVVETENGQYHGYYAHVGDGALSFWRTRDGASDAVNAFTCSEATILEAFLGPDVERGCFPRCFHSPLGDEFAVCAATDGIARAVPLPDLLAFWREQVPGTRANLARVQIARLKQERPDQVADNLSLAFVGRFPGPKSRLQEPQPPWWSR